ncbi:MAG TPA: hypothetical protein VER96_30830 [Polyangiaceae bacterium]|nr:hypothetical protein [Polyangiaceae bacterium]
MTEPNQASVQGSQTVALVLGWLAVVIPLGWGVVQTFKKALALFS